MNNSLTKHTQLLKEEIETSLARIILIDMSRATV